MTTARRTTGDAGDTRTRILDATVAAISQFGLARLTLEDVARQAGLSRQTVYRYFPNKDALIAAAVLHEEHRLLRAVLADVGEVTELRPAVERAIAAVLRRARAHPVLDRLLATEPEALLPYLLRGEGPVVSAARPVLETLLAERLPHLPPVALQRVADAVTRLLVSYVINPPAEPIEEVAAGLADLIVNGIKDTDGDTLEVGGR